MKKIAHETFERGLGVVGLLFKKIQNLTEKHAPQMGVFKYVL